MANKAALQWNKQRATLHANHGLQITLSTSCSVATRATEDAGQKVDGHGVVFTNPVPEGGMLRVAVLEHNKLFKGGPGVFLTTENPKTSSLTKAWMAATLDAPGQSQLIGVFNNKIFYGGRPLGARKNLSKSTESLKSGDSVGIRLVQGNKLELYYNDRLFNTFSLENGYLQKTPMWGVVDVYGSCVKVKADVWTQFLAPSTDTPQRLKKGASLDSSPTQQIKQLQKQLDNERATFAVEKVRLMKELSESARDQLVQERQEHQILLQEVEADLKSKTQLLEKQLEQEREETQLQLEAMEAELSHTKREVNGLRRQLSEAAERSRHGKKEHTHNHKLQELETENARLKKDLQELQESNILMRNPSVLRMAAHRPSNRRSETIQPELRRISGQDIWLRARGTQ